MKIHNVAQGSAEWHKLRLGIPTASCFHKIVTPTGKLSAQARNYMFTLIAEELLGYQIDNIDNIAVIARGKELEPRAVEMYEFERDCETMPAGFITTDDGRIGCTPDRLVGNAGALEIKCPLPNTHLCYMIDGFGNDYVPQAQGQMYVGEFEWVDRYSHHPELPPVLHRTYRDDAFIARLDAALRQFCDEKAAVLAKVKSRGYFADRDDLEAAFGLPPLPIRPQEAPDAREGSVAAQSPPAGETHSPTGNTQPQPIGPGMKEATPVGEPALLATIRAELAAAETPARCIAIQQLHTNELQQLSVPQYKAITGEIEARKRELRA